MPVWGNHDIARSGTTPLKLTGRRLFHHAHPTASAHLFVSLWQSRGSGFVLAHSVAPFSQNRCTAVAVTDVTEAMVCLKQSCAELRNLFQDRSMPLDIDRKLTEIINAHAQDNQLKDFLNLAGRAMAAWDEWMTMQTDMQDVAAKAMQDVETAKTNDTGTPHEDRQPLSMLLSRHRQSRVQQPCDTRAEPDPLAGNPPVSGPPSMHAGSAEHTPPALAQTCQISPPPVSVDARVDKESDLLELPGAGPGLVWMLGSCGVTSMQDLGRADPDTLKQELGLVGEILDVAYWISYAKENMSSR